MKTEEKARELASELIGEDKNQKPLIDVIMRMANWKEQQMIEKAVEWVKENYADFCREINYRDHLNECFDVQNFTKELRKGMKEQIMKTEKEKLVLNENAPKVIAAKLYCGWEILSLHIPNQYDKISNHYFYYYDVFGGECPVAEIEDYVVLES